MCQIKVSFAQSGWFHESKVEWNTIDCGNTMGYKRPVNLPKGTSRCNILNHTPIYSISLLRSIVIYHHLCSLNMLMNGHPPKTENMAHHGGLFHQQNLIWSLGVSGGVWELSDQIPRVVKSLSLLDQCGGLQLNLGAPGSGGDKPRSANHKPGSLSNHCRAVWERHYLLWECCRCTRKS
jgi:hypothetical protein